MENVIKLYQLKHNLSSSLTRVRGSLGINSSSSVRSSVVERRGRQSGGQRGAARFDMGWSWRELARTSLRGSSQRRTSTRWEVARRCWAVAQRAPARASRAMRGRRPTGAKWLGRDRAEALGAARRSSPTEASRGSMGLTGRRREGKGEVAAVKGAGESKK